MPAYGFTADDLRKLASDDWRYHPATHSFTETTMELTDQQREALRLLGVYTSNIFDFWRLAGPNNAKMRTAVMSALLGRKVPQKDAGVNAMRDAFYGFARPAGATLSAQCESFREWARATVVAAGAYDLRPPGDYRGRCGGTVLACADRAEAVKRAASAIASAGWPPGTPFYAWPEGRPDQCGWAEVPHPGW